MSDFDKELLDLGALALRSEFWRDFSRLVNSYCVAVEGLRDETKFLYDIQDLASVFGVASCVGEPVKITKVLLDGREVVCQNLLTALSSPGLSIKVGKTEAFIRYHDQWYYPN